MNNVNIYTAIQKCDNEYGDWCGYLRPDEILELIRRKLIISYKHDTHKLKWYEENQKNGICNPTWFYFQPRKKFLDYHERMMNLKRSKMNLKRSKKNDC